MKALRILACNFILAALLAGCASLGIQPADTFGKQLIVANSLVESVAVTAETLYAAGKINSDEARDVYRRGVDARSAIELARLVYVTDPAQASNRLSAIIVSLQAIESALRVKQ